MRERFVYKVSVEMWHDIFQLYVSDVIYDGMEHRFYGFSFFIFGLLHTYYISYNLLLDNNFCFYYYQSKRLYIYTKFWFLYINVKFYIFFFKRTL